MNSALGTVVRSVLVLALVSAISSCGGYGLTSTCSTYVSTLDIQSEPPGARIEIDDEYIGDAPLTYDVLTHMHHEGCLSLYGYPTGIQEIPTVHIRAIPTYPGLYTQTKDISRDDLIQKLDRGKKVTRLLFDTRLQPAPASYQFDIRNR